MFISPPHTYPHHNPLHPLPHTCIHYYSPVFTSTSQHHLHLHHRQLLTCTTLPPTFTTLLLICTTSHRPPGPHCPTCTTPPPTCTTPPPPVLHHHPLAPHCPHLHHRHKRVQHLPAPEGETEGGTEEGSGGQGHAYHQDGHHARTHGSCTVVRSHPPLHLRHQDLQRPTLLRAEQEESVFTQTLSYL